MRNISKAGILMVTALSLTTIGGASVAGAQGVDLDCGDPGTSHNMPIDPNNDPYRLDDDNDGIGCEDGSVFGQPPAPQPTVTVPPAPSVTVGPTPAPTPPPAPPARPVPGRPDFTG
jgi:hypothetical protein